MFLFSAEVILYQLIYLCQDASLHEATVILLRLYNTCVCVGAVCCLRPGCPGLHWVPLGSPLAFVDLESPDKEKTPLTFWGGEKKISKKQQQHI